MAAHAKLFTRLSKRAARFTGSATCFAVAVGIVVVWALTGPLFGFGETWQLVINTGTTIITFLMVFLIQNTQNRDTEAIQIKLDELLRSHRPANNALLDLEELEEEELDELRKSYEALAEKSRHRREPGQRKR
ncbi:MAG: low affinity iron permease family protein [Lysobacter sp.]|nr:low affinity iron permease family protein [Lysobacter sp.]